MHTRTQRSAAYEIVELVGRVVLHFGQIDQSLAEIVLRGGELLTHTPNQHRELCRRTCELFMTCQSDYIAGKLKFCRNLTARASAHAKHSGKNHDSRRACG